MKSEQKPLILVTNDDGVTAPGVRALIQMMNEIGEVYVVAPDDGGKTPDRSALCHRRRCGYLRRTISFVK